MIAAFGLSTTLLDMGNRIEQSDSSGSVYNPAAAD